MRFLVIYSNEVAISDRKAGFICVRFSLFVCLFVCVSVCLFVCVCVDISAQAPKSRKIQWPCFFICFLDYSFLCVHVCVSFPQAHKVLPHRKSTDVCVFVCVCVSLFVLIRVSVSLHSISLFFPHRTYRLQFPSFPAAAPGKKEKAFARAWISVTAASRRPFRPARPRREYL